MNRVETYSVRGRTVEELRAAMLEASGNPGNSSHGAASATFRFTPSLGYKELSAGCILSKVMVRLDTTVVLPEWISSTSADDVTVAAWRRFKHYLEAHEARHVAIASDYRKVMASELATLGVMPNCPTLGQEVDSVVSAVED